MVRSLARSIKITGPISTKPPIPKGVLESLENFLKFDIMKRNEIAFGDLFNLSQNLKYS
jgi:hypothetical protein